MATESVLEGAARAREALAASRARELTPEEIELKDRAKSAADNIRGQLAFAGTSVTEIAQKLGIPEPRLRRHFREGKLTFAEFVAIANVVDLDWLEIRERALGAWRPRVTWKPAPAVPATVEPDDPEELAKAERLAESLGIDLDDN